MVQNWGPCLEQCWELLLGQCLGRYWGNLLGCCLGNDWDRHWASYWDSLLVGC